MAISILRPAQIVYLREHLGWTYKRIGKVWDVSPTRARDLYLRTTKETREKINTIEMTKTEKDWFYKEMSLSIWEAK